MAVLWEINKCYDECNKLISIPYSAIRTFCVGTTLLCFWKKSLVLAKAEFI